MSITPHEPARPDADASGAAEHGISRRGLIGGIAAATGITVLAASASSASATNEGQDGSVSEAPRLPDGFTNTFKDRFVDANGIRQHVAIGGSGPPLLLVHGWPENWYAWRFLMPALAEDFTVIAADQRGIGLSEKTKDGYDSATLANDLVALMDKLGHKKFSVVGHDTGYIISYALAADHRGSVNRLALAEIPGPPTLATSPPMFVPAGDNNRLWHIPFNRVDDELIVNMVRSNANEFYRYEFAIQGGGKTLPDYAIKYYVDLYNRNKDSLRATFGLYRAWDATLKQNAARKANKLTIPVLGIGGENSWGPAAAGGMMDAATNVTAAVIAGSGHWVAEQGPKQMVDVLRGFLAP